jgi:hypothetical protein
MKAHNVFWCLINEIKEHQPLLSVINSYQLCCSNIEKKIHKEKYSIILLLLSCYRVLCYSWCILLVAGFLKPKTLDPRMTIPIFDKLFHYLPEKCLKPLRFGIVHERVSSAIIRTLHNHHIAAHKELYIISDWCCLHTYDDIWGLE